MGNRSKKNMIWVGFKNSHVDFRIAAGSTLKKLSDEIGIPLTVLKSKEKKLGDSFLILADEADSFPWFVKCVPLAKIDGRGGLRKAGGGNSGFGGFLGMKGKDGMLKGE